MKNKEGREKCRVSLKRGENIRHCFMSGEYCSHQTNILEERERLHKKNTISAFIIMNFSNMSDVVYKWRIKGFVESLKNYLCMNSETKELICFSSKNERDEYEKGNENVVKVKDIQVERADSESATNYVICDRICQQMLIADLVIVDVSWQNPNVFYEFGMAVALGKLILPICYSESFYKKQLPTKLKKIIKKDSLPYRKQLENHIGCFPWRKILFEYYGIRYKEKNDVVKYLKFKEAVNKSYGFSDSQYSSFPYSTVISLKEQKSPSINKKKIGERIYRKLARQYNEKEFSANTAVIYTMDRILNEEQAGRCIINYYRDIVESMKQEECFCGERVGVLVQGYQIPEKDKDVFDSYNLLYRIAEVTRIGVNQATYQVSKDRIVSEDVFHFPALDAIKERIKDIEVDKKGEDFKEVHEEDIRRFVKNHIRNRGMLIYPDYPVYVERMKNGICQNLLEDECPVKEEKNKKSFCLYHVMLKTLRYTNQVVVDITNNNLQSLFWLGAAHGAEVHAVTVLHQASEYEQRQDSNFRKRRNVFDVSGLWTAVHYTHDTDGFYKHLSLVQKGIEEHSKLILKSSDSLETYLEKEEEKSNEELGLHLKTELQKGKAELWQEKKRKEERQRLEAYYRDWFWKPMLRYNRLRIYLPQRDKMETGEPFLQVAKWDMDAVSSLTHYLSRRSIIGEYKVITLPRDKIDTEAEKVNYITIGYPIRPDGYSLPEHIKKSFQEHKKCVRIYECKERGFQGGVITRCKQIKREKGFVQLGNEENKIVSQHSTSNCINMCSSKEEDMQEEIMCDFWNKDSHTEIAQLILWREKSKNKEYLFRVGITGSSGPATYALSSLMVDEKNKLCDFLSSDKKESAYESKPLLYNLQLKIREYVMQEYLKCLEESIRGSLNRWSSNEKNQKESYCYLVMWTTGMYLSTVLYRYFFPFLSQKDIQRIVNGMHMFINSMKESGISPFSLDYSSGKNSNFKTVIPKERVEEIIRSVPEILKDVLERFEGVQVFYKVNVQHRELVREQENGVMRDIRKVKSIEEYKKDDGNIDLEIFLK